MHHARGTHGFPAGPVPLAAAWQWPGLPKGAWGPLAWHWLHALAILYPRAPTPADARAAAARIRHFVAHLPCADCRRHALRYLQRRPPELASTGALQAWAWRFHNAVNARLGKPLLSCDAYLALYARERYWASGGEAGPTPQAPAYGAAAYAGA